MNVKELHNVLTIVDEVVLGLKQVTDWERCLCAASFLSLRRPEHGVDQKVEVMRTTSLKVERREHLLQELPRLLFSAFSVRYGPGERGLPVTTNDSSNIIDDECVVMPLLTRRQRLQKQAAGW